MPIAKKAYILNRDGIAVENTGKQSGAVLVGKGGTISDEMALRHGVEVYTPEEITASREVEENKRVADLNAARLGLGAAPSQPSGQVTDKAAADGAKQTATAVATGKSSLTPVTPNSEPAGTA